MSNIELTTREQALEWWNSLLYTEKQQYKGYLDKYTSMDSPVDPILFVDEETIEEIWQKEVNHEKISKNKMNKNIQKSMFTMALSVLCLFITDIYSNSTEFTIIGLFASLAFFIQSLVYEIKAYIDKKFEENKPNNR